MNDPIDVFKYYSMRPGDECWPYEGNAWGGSAREKRPYFMAAGRRQIAYRWIYELVNGVQLTPDQMILHSCDNGGWPIACGNPKHMRLGTAQENMNDMMMRQRHGMPKTVVNTIRNMLKEGRTQEDIARHYGVARTTISAIAVGRTHKTKTAAPQGTPPNADDIASWQIPAATTGTTTAQINPKENDTNANRPVSRQIETNEHGRQQHTDEQT